MSPWSERRLIVRMIYGSHLYGTDTETSDRDFKGIFIPTMEEILLQRVPRSVVSITKKANGVKNEPGDVDTELYSIGYFLELALKGETVALDMLHAPPSALLDVHPFWSSIVARRASFYTKNLRALVGYARRQAAKYGVKGSRLADAERVLAWLEGLEPEDRLGQHWAGRPSGEHLHDVVDQEVRGQNLSTKIWDVCGRKLQSTVRVRYACGVVQDFVRAYGARAQAARDNQGIDWKAVSHALRAGYEVRAILRDGGFTFPLPETGILRDVKAGKLDYLTVVAPSLDTLLDECEFLAERSELPERAQRAEWDDWLLELHEDVVRSGRLYRRAP